MPLLYQAYELSHAAITPWREAAKYSREALESDHNPWRGAAGMRTTLAAFQMFENATKRYGKPEFGVNRVEINGKPAAIIEETVWSKPFCDLLHFQRFGSGVDDSAPKVLMIAPMSGHFATLLRGTVATMLQTHDVYITDWRDARTVPLAEGGFDLDDYIDYIREMLRFLGPDVTLMGVCQPGVPALAATALMCEDNEPERPSALVMMGSPIDTRISPTEPNNLAESRPLSWFDQNVTSWVPWPNPGFLRKVYPGFLQLSSFMAMNIDRHMDAHVKQFENLITGDDDSATAHREFYDEYLAVMDLTAEFYLQTIDRVFQRHLLAKGEYLHRGRLVDPSKITDVGLFTIEGGKDDITGAGQTHAAQGLCVNLPDDKRKEFTHPDVGHYGQFNGGRWRRDIYPQVGEFIKAHLRG